ncbi:MAG: hypothetical protein CL946_04945 [Ectothiorhodospiraceae bacterium]|nr:hypothetical protein [Ectothiorhodospiraceae bacterium]
MKPLRLLFDGRAFTPRRSGIGEYSYYLLQALLTHFADEIDVSLYAAEDVVPVRSIGEVEEATRDVQPGDLYKPTEQLRLPKILDPRRFDLYHCPDYSIPLLNSSFPIIATIHDVVPLVYPDMMKGSLKVKLLPVFKWYLRNALKRSRSVITVSEFSKQEMNRFFGGLTDRVEVIHSAPYHPEKRPAGEAEVPNIEPRSYFLYVGRQEPYKGIRELIESFKRVYHDVSERVPFLVITGEVDERYQWDRVVQESGMEGRVRFTGYVSREQLTWLYTNASAFVFPSLYEGFGFPPLDAMAFGLPVACSNRASLPEVAGEAARMFDPGSNESIDEALKDIALNDTLRAELIVKGENRLRVFSWQATAEKTMNVYRKAIK